MNLSSTKYHLLHIPKTGGTYIAQLEVLKKPIVSPIKYLGHSCINEDTIQRKAYEINGYSKKIYLLSQFDSSAEIMSVIRNPFDWLVSYASHAGGWNPAYRNIRHIDYKNANRGIDYLVNTISDREDVWPSRYFPFHALFSEKGNLIVDYIFRNESLDHQLKIFANKNNLSFQQRKKMRLGKRDNYKKYFNDKTIQIVNDMWPEFNKFFGYSFDDMETQNSQIPIQITDHIKRKFKFSDGRVIFTK